MATFSQLQQNLPTGGATSQAAQSGVSGLTTTGINYPDPEYLSALQQVGEPADYGPYSAEILAQRYYGEDGTMGPTYVPKPNASAGDILKAVYANPPEKASEIINNLTPEQRASLNTLSDDQLAGIANNPVTTAARYIAFDNPSGAGTLNSAGLQAVAASGLNQDEFALKVVQDQVNSFQNYDGGDAAAAELIGRITNPFVKANIINPFLGGTLPNPPTGAPATTTGDGTSGDQQPTPAPVTSSNSSIGQQNAANITNPAMPVGGEYDAVLQQKQEGEDLTNTTTQGNPQVTTQNVEMPNAPNVGQANASLLGDNVPQATAAQGEVSQTITPEQANTNQILTPEQAQAELTAPPTAIETPFGVLSPDAISEFAQTNLTPEMMVTAAQAQLTPEQLVQSIEFQASQEFEAAVQKAETDAVNFPFDNRMTVAEQYKMLTDGIEDGNVPGWARSAVTAANQMAARRGIGFSSAAVGAVTEQVFKAALPIAVQDAKLFETIGIKEFDARQQATLLRVSHLANLDSKSADFRMQAGLQNAQTALQINLSNLSAEQQARITNAQNLVETAQQNTGYRQQTALANAAAHLNMDLKNLDNETLVRVENARQAIQVSLANLSSRSQTSIANLGVRADAAQANLQAAQQTTLANLNSRQLSNVENAKNFLQMDLSNLTNRQQAAIISTQARVQAALSDQSALNAMEQLNTQNEKDIEIFMAGLAGDINKFQAAQFLEAGQFNAQMTDIRERFNVENQLLVDQSNVNYLRAINTENTALKNKENFTNSQNLLEISNTAMANAIQLLRDDTAYAFQVSENEKDRATRLAIAQMQADTNLQLASKATKYNTGVAVGGFITDTLGALGGLFDDSGGGDSGGGGGDLFDGYLEI